MQAQAAEFSGYGGKFRCFGGCAFHILDLTLSLRLNFASLCGEKIFVKERFL
jgi:hypothetical protein